MKRIAFFIAFMITALLIIIGLTIAQNDKESKNILANASKKLNSDVLQKIQMNSGELNSCEKCHKNFPETHKLGKAYTLYSKSIHFEKGLQCIECHGGDSSTMNPTKAMDPKNGFIGVPSRKDIPLVCARCHSDSSIMNTHNSTLPNDQLAKYISSAHGKTLQAGDTGVAVCIDCHNHHDILPKENINSKVFINNIANTCSKCHPKNAELFLKSPHKEAFANAEKPQCTFCHGQHDTTRKFHGLVSGDNITCSNCHSDNQLETVFGIEGKNPQQIFKQTFGEQVKAELNTCNKCHHQNQSSVDKIKQISTELSMKTNLVEGKFITAEHKGVETPNEFAKLKQIKSAENEMATMRHGVDFDKYVAKYQEISTELDTLSKEGDKLLEEIESRTLWFIPAFLITTFILVVLVLFIRDIEKNKEDE